jgi:hypothetical protein
MKNLSVFTDMKHVQKTASQISVFCAKNGRMYLTVSVGVPCPWLVCLSACGHGRFVPAKYKELDVFGLPIMCSIHQSEPTRWQTGLYII